MRCLPPETADRVCTTCRVLQPLQAYARKASFPLGRQYVCRACFSTAKRETRAKDPAKARAAGRRWSRAQKETTRWRRILKVYGLTRLQWEAMFDAQGQRCACCGSDTPQGKRGWHVDHDHKTEVVRGILCQRCNPMLGCAQDSIEILQAGIAYLMRRK